MENLTSIKGKLLKQIYRNNESCYSVISFECEDGKIITITGTLPILEEDSVYKFYGQYSEHYKYGMQFTVNFWEKVLPNSADAIINYLSSPVFSGIGKKMAKTIVDELGESALELIIEDATVLDKIHKLSSKKKQVIIDVLNNRDDETEKILKFFSMHGISNKNSFKIQKVYGLNAIEIIKNNPYQLIYDIDGIGFKTADKIAKSLGIKPEDYRRSEAFLLDILNKYCMSTGDTFVFFDDLKDIFNNEVNKEGLIFDFDSTLNSCLSRKIFVKKDERIYLKSQYDAQEFISSFLVQFPFENLYDYDKNELKKSLSEIQEKLNINYDEIQMQAIETFFDNDLMILTGGPGTGKTTVVRGIVHTFKKLFPYSQVCCCAPTGRAAKRLSELTETNTNTIHSLLQWDLETNTFGKNDKEPLNIDLLVIDEFSMVDNWLFYNLLKASAYVKKICIIGDEDQLPSVGPGCLLKDLINTNLWPIVRLKKIFRQAEGSGVIKLADEIKNNNVNFEEIANDVAFYNVDSFNVSTYIINIINKAILKGYDLNDIQVLSCMYKGLCGIDYLNVQLQKVFNPKNDDLREIKVDERIFRVNDKILQLKNQPDDDVYNGDIGILVDIEYASENQEKVNKIFIDFDGILVEYTQENFVNIKHAYCISIHKSQGSEYPIVIVPIVKENSLMLEKKLIYTAVTRAKKSVIILGDKNIFLNGIEIENKHIRNSILSDEIVYKKNLNFFE